jgi:putative SOS response-associated peptidase YedK
MCASYGLQIDGTEESFDERLASPDLADWMRENAGATVRPTGVRARNTSPIVSADGFELAWWGMWEDGAPSKRSTINAKVENLRRAPLWRAPYAHGRILVPVSEYYEYQHAPTPKRTRVTFRVPGVPLFAIAGIASPIPEPETAPTLFGDEETGPRSSFAIITRAPTEAAAEVHDRMPLVLPPSFYDDWLDPGNAGDDSLRASALAASDELAERLGAHPD